MERKDFLKTTFALCGLSMIPAGLIQSCSKPSNNGPTNVNFTLDLTNSANASLNNTGGAITANGVIVVNSGGGVFHALSASCTHEGCAVNYNASSSTIVCPCHGGSFNASTGAVLGGPPPSPLSTYMVTRSGNTLTVKS